VAYWWCQGDPRTHPEPGRRAPLSYVGDTFDYDVFVSYAHAEVETKAPLIRDWSRNVAGRLSDLLATALNVQGSSPESEVQVFLDDRVLVSGQPLTQTLREKAQRSALLLVLMSPLYPRKTWCLNELEWFFEKAAQDGRGQEHCTVLRIQPLEDGAWPKRLQDERGKPVAFLDLMDAATELPIGLTGFGAAQLDEALLKIFIEIKGKLVSLNKHFEARRRMAAPAKQKPADRPVIYLDADPHDKDLWETLKGALKGVAIVRPTSLPQAGSDSDPLDRKQQKVRQDEFQLSDGLVLLHGHPGPWIERAVAISYLDRRLLRQRHRDLPWAILDPVGQRPPVADDYDVPCVVTTSKEWQRELLTVLELAPPVSASAP
jgi:hypothetical protein